MGPAVALSEEDCEAAAASAANMRANRDERGFSSTALMLSFSFEDEDGIKKSAKTDFGGTV